MSETHFGMIRAPESDRYAERLAAGLCTSCGGKRGRGGTATKCRPCADSIAAANAARHADLIAQGLCVKCGVEPAAEGRKRCTACLAYHAHRDAARRSHQ